MKTVILAGGLGTRLAEETDVTPKPMVEIGGSPILWHIMKIYATAASTSSSWRSATGARSSSATSSTTTTLRNDLTIARRRQGRGARRRSATTG